MQTKKLHELIQLAKDGKKFKAITRGLAEFLCDWHFKTSDSWSKDSILADWEYQEIRKPEVVEFELDCKEFKQSYALVNQRFGPTNDLYNSLRGKKWKVVCTEVMGEI